MLTYLDRDLIRSFLIAFLVFMIFIQLGLFVSVLLDQFKYIFGEGESKLKWVLLYFVLGLPRHLAHTIPVATAVTLLLVYTVKARQNEILAYLVGGVSPARLAAPLLVCALILSGVAYATTELVANDADAAAERIRKVHIEGRSMEAITREKNVFQKGQGGRFYNVRSFRPLEKKMDLPIIFQLSEDWGTTKWRLDAQGAELVETPQGEQWRFRGVIYREFDKYGNVTSFVEKTEALETEVLPERLEAELGRYLQQRFRPSQMNSAELLEYIDLFRLQGKPTYELATHLHFNMALPLGCLVLACLMVGHILRPASTGVLVGFGGGLIFVALYYTILIAAREMSKSGAIWPPLGAHGVNVLFLVVALVMLNRNRMMR